MNPPKTPSTFVSQRFYSNVVNRTLVEWYYRDAGGELYGGIAQDETGAKVDAERHGYQDPENTPEPSPKDAAREVLLKAADALRDALAKDDLWSAHWIMRDVENKLEDPEILAAYGKRLEYAGVGNRRLADLEEAGR